MSTFQTFNPFGNSQDDSIRSLVGSGLNVPIGQSRGPLRSPTPNTMTSGGSLLNRGQPGMAAGGRGLSSTSPGSRYIQPGFNRRGSVSPQSLTSMMANLGRMSTGSGQQPGVQGGLLGQLGSALGEETGMLQDAADRQFLRNQEPIDDMRNLIGRSGEITQVGERTANDLTALGDKQRNEFETGVTEAMDRFDSTYADDVIAHISGVRESMQPTLNAIRNGLNPDGSMMTPAQRKDATYAVTMQTNSQVQQVATTMASQYNEARAALAQGFSGQRLSSQQLAGAYTQAASAVRNAAQATALQFEAQGIQSMADLIYRNPESIVSRFQGLLALAGVATAPGARALQPVPL